jgi:hypothetical protein
MAYELHYYPGRFGDGVRGLLDRLVGGATALKLRSFRPALGEGAREHAQASTDVAVAWLADVAPGEMRSALAEFDRLGRTASAGIVVRGVRGGRALVAIGFPAEAGLSASDAELALLGVVVSSLAKESQGAGLIGYDLGDPGRFGAEGTVAEQVRAAVAEVGTKVLAVIAAPDTAASLGELEGFYRRPFVNLFEYRRTGPA